MTRAALMLLAAFMLGYGLWTHDWRVIVAAATIMCVWPLIHHDVYEERRHQRNLDELWDD